MDRKAGLRLCAWLAAADVLAEIKTRTKVRILPENERQIRPLLSAPEASRALMVSGVTVRPVSAQGHSVGRNGHRASRRSGSSGSSGLEGRWLSGNDAHSGLFATTQG
jgi:hypothetical protein